MRLWVIAASMMLVPGTVSAQQSDEDVLASMGIRIVQPMTPSELAETRQRVAAELARSGHAALFDDVSDAGGGKVRHRASGLVCALGEPGQRIIAASSDQAACEYVADSTTYRKRVARAPEGASLESIAARTLAAIEQEPGYRSQEGLAVTGTPRPGSGRPDHRTFRFTSRNEGRERASRIQVGIVRGWVLSERRDGRNRRSQEALMGDLMSEATFGSSMEQQ